MSFLLNERSLHAQFGAAEQVRQALSAVMALRHRVTREGHELQCHRDLLARPATPALDLRAVVAAWPDRGQRSALLVWLANKGPYWQDAREHSSELWFEVGGDVVTDSAVAEAAERARSGRPSDLVSFAPSLWTASPIVVEERDDGGVRSSTPVVNHVSAETLEPRLLALRAPMRSWSDLEVRSRACAPLVFASDAFAPLSDQPFHEGIAEELLARVEVLARLAGCLRPDGSLAPEGLELREEFFVGGKAWFSDSSADEMSRFSDELTFRDPLDPARSLFCTWHGKVKNRQMRLHYGWPLPNPGEPIRVTYVGPKITKR